MILGKAGPEAINRPFPNSFHNKTLAKMAIDGRLVNSYTFMRNDGQFVRSRRLD